MVRWRVDAVFCLRCFYQYGVLIHGSRASCPVYVAQVFPDRREFSIGVRLWFVGFNTRTPISDNNWVPSSDTNGVRTIPIESCRFAIVDC